MNDFSTLILILPVLLLSVILHEWAHARVAVWQGDPTPAMLGRLTLNPLPHIDPIGSVLVPVVLWLLPGSFLFGWAKPVPVNSRNFKNYRKGDILVSLAGVTVNFLLALAFVLVFALLSHVLRWAGGPVADWAVMLRGMARYGIFINLILGVFNLIPVPPLDGSHVLYHFLPPDLGARYRALGRYSLVLLAAVMFFPGILSFVLYPVHVLDGAAMSLAFALS
ncbi:MAG TPA: site-2 protease family protein [Gemmatimonadota bacterium]|nr:site-2 protease family protein [Gemmatimonadota bacterium]